MTTMYMKAFEMFKRVRDYGASRTADFPPDGLGGQLFALLASVIAKLAEQAMLQTASTGGALVGSANKATLRVRLRQSLRFYNRTGRAIVAGNPALKKKFRMPESGDERLLSAARAFLELAQPLAAEFIKREVPADFLEKLKSDIDAFEGAMTERNQHRDSRVKARAAMKSLVTSGLQVVSDIDVVVRNKFVNDEPNLSAWETACHVERTSGRSKNAAIPDQAKGDPAKPNPPQASLAG